MSSTKKPVAKVLILLAIPVILGVLFFRGLSSFVEFHVTKDLSYEMKASQAKQALMPEIADYIERYGLRGFQDVDLQIETVKFNSIDELVETFPCLARYETAETHVGRDVKNKSATVYEIETFSPSKDRTSCLPLDTSSIKPDSQINSWTWKYSIYEYNDGSCRFVILVMPYQP